MKNNTLREIEEINNPRPMVFIGDVIIKGIAAVVFGGAIGGIGWLALIGLDRVFQTLGI